jgi:ribosome-binding factor A
MSSRRQRQVAELLHEELSQLIQYDTRDPRLGFVTVTGVDVTADLRIARVYVTVLGDEKEAQLTLKGLESAAGFFRYKLKQQLSLRYIPELNFKLDTSLEYASRIEQLLDMINAEAGQTQSSTESAPTGEDSSGAPFESSKLTD